MGSTTRNALISAVLLVTVPLIGSSVGVTEQIGCDGVNGMSCVFPEDCQLGKTLLVNCTSRKGYPNPVSKTNVEAICQFCWQLPETDYDCAPVTNCSTSSTKLIANQCTAYNSVICMGQRQFNKRVRCNWSSGYSWTKTMVFSVVLGGFGANRFYLSLWKSAIGKLFTFRGLGVWTIVDVVLIAVCESFCSFSSIPPG